MALANNLFFLFLHHLLLLNLVDSKCQKSFYCGKLGSLEFPLSPKNPECGLFMVDHCDSEYPKIQLAAGGPWFDILSNLSTNRFLIRNPELQKLLTEQSCLSVTNVSLPQSPSISVTVSPNLTLFTCHPPYGKGLADHFNSFRLPKPCPFTVHYKNLTSGAPAPEQLDMLQNCLMFQVPTKPTQDQDSSKLFDRLSANFTLEWDVSEACHNCHHGGGQCVTNNMNEFYCKKGESRLTLILSISGGGVLLVLLCLLISYIIWLRKKRINGGYLLSRNISSNPPQNQTLKVGASILASLFSHTQNLKRPPITLILPKNSEMEALGLCTMDGREVAIKRLYEHNYRRVEQFLNEIKILTGLRHPNLVSLYGCTSRRSRELLLVYEYISNGTVADHLHGERAKEAPLSWPIRMNIAIETATALAYLHKSDIIHRDVKTNNILLDNNFCVKVADFGLSKLFPNDVTHISTAPQGTPGYVDPEYHQCYQLTDKSDVYSFGVVLIELISSMPAVDISRHRHEVNLANLAVNRIQRCAFDELIDPSLGYDSDPEVTRMTTTVAELAFRCLQLEKELRPCMEEVLAFLKDIQGGEDCNFEQIKGANGSYSVPGKIPPSPETNDVLLKNKNFQSSPTAVTATWASISSTTASSTG